MLLTQLSLRPNALLPTEHGEFQIYSIDSGVEGQPHIVLIPRNRLIIEPCLLRIHSECVTGEVFLSQRCDCGYQLGESMELIHKEGGILIYLRQEGRGIGLDNKIKAYALQDDGMDTIEANHKLGYASDERNYQIAVDILKEVMISSVRLITNNPLKIDFLVKNNIQVVETISIIKPKDIYNESYMRTKRDKMGHLIPE